ncbi:MAG: nitrogen regulation protein NR(II) [Desulfovibrionaceae bacterium]
MEVRAHQREKGPIVAAVIALIVLGLGSIFLTWQSIKRQRAVVENHMVLSSRVIIRGVEANLMRILRSTRSNPAMQQVFPGLVAELFQELTASGEVPFTGLYDDAGVPLITSTKEGEKPLGLPPAALESLRREGHWSGMTVFEKRQVLVAALRTRGALGFYARGETPPSFAPPGGHEEGHEGGRGMGQGMGQGMGRGMGRGMGMGMGQGMLPPDGEEPLESPGPAVYLVTGLAADKHLVQFDQYRRAALFQTGYVFLAAMLLWSLAFAYLRRREQGKQLVRLERFQSKLLDEMPDGLVTLGPGGEILAANGSAVRLLAEEGAAPARLVGAKWRDFPFADLGSAEAWRQYEYGGKRLEMLCVPFQDAPPDAEDGEAPMEERLILIRDRTKIRALEEDLEEANRLATVGSLAAGVAHEVRNPLSSLRGFAQFFADKLKNQEPFASYATTMVQEADRLNRVVTDLLFLARPVRHDPHAVDLPDLVRDLKKLLRFDLEHRHVALECGLAASTVHADPDALKQVLLNLLANSLDAVPEQGGEVRIVSSRQAGGVWIGVQDNGPGMPEDIKRQAFEPFVTGKKTGTGLGLAIVRTIVRSHHGQVDIDSGPGRGTLVRLFFPDPEPAPAPDADPAPASGPNPDSKEQAS